MDKQKINIEAIPQELKALQQWVLYRLVWNEQRKKHDKIPYQANGRYAKSNDPKTWATFENVLEVLNAGKFDGIGFVFTKDDPYCGIDLDCCIDETGKIAEWAQKWLICFNSYTEYSPSGTGLHSILKCKLPLGGRKKGNYECYDEGRFFTVTGKHLEGTPSTIENRQEEIAKFHFEIFGQQRPEIQVIAPVVAQISDDEIITKAKAAKNGDKFSALWNGDINGYPSQSEADLALCSILVFWTRDPVSIDRLFRRSKLIRPKWDEKHFSGGKTYGQSVIEKAISSCKDIYNKVSNPNLPSELIVYSAKELGETELQPISWVIPQLLPEGLTMLAGKPKKGKSWLALDIAIATATGGKVLGHQVEQGVVLYVALEDGRRRIKERIKKLLAPGEVFPENLKFVDNTKFPPFNKGGYDLLLKWIDQHNPKIVIIDTLGRVMPSPQKNNSQYNHEYNFLSLLQAEAVNRRMSIFLVHHLRKAIADDPFDCISGTLGITGALDTMWVLMSSPTDKANAILHISGRDITTDDFALSFNSGIWSMIGLAEDHLISDIRRRIIEFLKSGPAGAKEISAALGISIEILWQRLYQMKRDGQVISVGRGKYKIGDDICPF